MQNEVKREIIEDRQVFIETDGYSHDMVTSVPPVSSWSNWNKPTMREAKRATKQIEKLMREGNGSIEWFEGWANQPDNKPENGLLSFGGDFSTRIKLSAKQTAYYSSREPYGRWDTPEYRQQNAFKNWLYKTAEGMGYEVTDQDQTSRCCDCSLAIDTGSSTPDNYMWIDGEGELCQLCANKNPVSSIETSMNNDPFFGRLNWEPKLPQRFDYEKGFCQVEFENIDKAELFSKLYLKGRGMKTYQHHGYSWDPVEGFFFVDDLSFDVKDKRNDDDSPSNMSQAFDIDTFCCEEVEIEWKHANFPTRLNQKSDQGILWEDIRDCLEAEEEKTPLLVWFCKGWITKGLWFQRDTATFNELIESWRSSGHERLTELIDQNLGLSRTELDELP